MPYFVLFHEMADAENRQISELKGVSWRWNYESSLTTLTGNFYLTSSGWEPISNVRLGEVSSVIVMTYRCHKKLSKFFEKLLDIFVSISMEELELNLNCKVEIFPQMCDSISQICHLSEKNVAMFSEKNLIILNTIWIQEWCGALEERISFPCTFLSTRYSFPFAADSV